jgi:hypothetical protein
MLRIRTPASREDTPHERGADAVGHRLAQELLAVGEEVRLIQCLEDGGLGHT